MEEGRNAEAETGQRDHWTTGPRDGGATRKHRETTKTIVLWSLQRNPWDALQSDGPSPRPSPHRMGRGRSLGLRSVVVQAANLAVMPQSRFPVFPFSRRMVVAVTLQVWQAGGERVC